jgi:hypothetical protein
MISLALVRLIIVGGSSLIPRLMTTEIRRCECIMDIRVGLGNTRRVRSMRGDEQSRRVTVIDACLVWTK